VVVTRMVGTVEFPARFTLVAASVEWRDREAPRGSSHPGEASAGRTAL
jgi:hypothetical protein